MFALSTVPAWLQQRWHFETNPWAALRRFGLATGLVLLLLFWLQPFGGERYRAPWWALRLLGYGVCLLLAVLPMRAWALRRRARQPLWRLQDELQALAIWAACGAGLSYAHSCWLVSPRTPSWVDFFMFSLVFALPFLLMLLPLLLWQGRADVLAVQLAAPTAESQASTTAPAAGASPQIVVQGRNRDEQLCFRREQLVCAQAQQNYVRLQLEAEDGSGIQAHLLRMPLGELAASLAAGETACWRVHRSWLVAPERVQAWVQTGRQRQLRLRGLDALIPVSADFELPPEQPSAGLDATQIRP